FVLRLSDHATSQFYALSLHDALPISDTEVLLQLYVHERADCLPRLNGFFVFCVYDRIEQSFFIARDRYGEKPLLYLFDEDKFILDRKSTRLNSSHVKISYAVFCLKKT